MGIKTVVVGTDFSEIGDGGVRDAVAFARRHQAERVHVVHVVGTTQASTVFPYAMTAQQVVELETHAQTEALDRLARLTSNLGPPTVTHEVRLGIPARELAFAARDVGADLLFVSSHGYGGFKRFILGSVTTALIRVVSCPSIVVGPGRAYRAPKTVLAAVDLSSVSAEVARQAIMMARSEGGQVRILSLFEHPLVHVPQEELLPRYFSREDTRKLETRHREFVEALLADIPHADVEVQIEAVSKSPPGLAILEVATLIGADLLVIGTSGHNAWHRMILGSTAGRVVSEALCPVLVIPHGQDADALK